MSNLYENEIYVHESISSNKIQKKFRMASYHLQKAFLFILQVTCTILYVCFDISYAQGGGLKLLSRRVRSSLQCSPTLCMTFSFCIFAENLFYSLVVLSGSQEEKNRQCLDFLSSLPLALPKPH